MPHETKHGKKAIKTLISGIHQATPKRKTGSAKHPTTTTGRMKKFTGQRTSLGEAIHRELTPTGASGDTGATGKHPILARKLGRRVVNPSGKRTPSRATTTYGRMTSSSKGGTQNIPGKNRPALNRPLGPRKRGQKK